VSRQLVNKTVDNISFARFHFIAFGYDFWILFCCVLIQTFVLYVS